MLSRMWLALGSYLIAVFILANAYAALGFGTPSCPFLGVLLPFVCLRICVLIS